MRRTTIAVALLCSIAVAFAADSLPMGEWLKKVPPYPANVDAAVSCAAQKLDEAALTRQVSEEAQRMSMAMTRPMAGPVSDSQRQAMQVLNDPEVMACLSRDPLWPQTLVAARQDLRADLEKVRAEDSAALKPCVLSCADCTGHNPQCKARVDREYNNGAKARAAAQKMLDRNRKPYGEARTRITQCIAKRDAARASLQKAGMLDSPMGMQVISSNDVALLGQASREVQADCETVRAALDPKQFQ